MGGSALYLFNDFGDRKGWVLPKEDVDMIICTLDCKRMGVHCFQFCLDEMEYRRADGGAEEWLEFKCGEEGMDPKGGVGEGEWEWGGFVACGVVPHCFGSKIV